MIPLQPSIAIWFWFVMEEFSIEACKHRVTWELWRSWVYRKSRLDRREWVGGGWAESSSNFHHSDPLFSPTELQLLKALMGTLSYCDNLLSPGLHCCVSGAGLHCCVSGAMQRSGVLEGFCCAASKSLGGFCFHYRTNYKGQHCGGLLGDMRLTSGRSQSSINQYFKEPIKKQDKNYTSA